MRRITSITNIRDIVNNLKKTCVDVKNSQFYFIEMADIIFSIPHIEEILDSYTENQSNSAWKQKTTEFLRKRGEIIINGPICHTLNTEYSINWICEDLAQLCDRDKKISLLFPTVQQEDIYGNELNSLDFGKFIVSDDKQTFIALETLVETACSKMLDSETTIYLTTTASGSQRTLSKTELERLGNFYSKIENIRTVINERSFISKIFKRESQKLYDELIALREGLMKGDVSHDGQEMNAGSAANIAIVRFSNYYLQLSDEKRLQIRNIRSSTRSLGDVFNLLFRDPQHSRSDEGTAVRYCLQIIGRHLEEVISENRTSLMNMSLDKEERIQHLKNYILQEISVARRLDPSAIINIPLTEQIQSIINVINQNLEPSERPQHKGFLCAFSSFVIMECMFKIEKKKYDAQFNAYINLLFAIGLESSDFSKRSGTDNLLVLSEIFKRISLISCASSKGFNFGKQDSKKRWENLITENKLIRENFSGIPINKIITNITEYNVVYPIDQQRQLLSENIIRLRTEEAEQKRVEAERQEMERIEAEQRALEAQQRNQFQNNISSFWSTQNVTNTQSNDAPSNKNQESSEKNSQSEQNSWFGYSFWSTGNVTTLASLTFGAAAIIAYGMFKKA